MATIEVVKYEGLGNDFLIVLDRQGDAPYSPEIAVALCDRHRGLGADGLIRLSESETGEKSGGSDAPCDNHDLSSSYEAIQDIHYRWVYHGRSSGW